MILRFAGELGLQQVECVVVLNFHVYVWFRPLKVPCSKKRKRNGAAPAYRN